MLSRPSHEKDHAWCKQYVSDQFIKGYIQFDRSIEIKPSVSYSEDRFREITSVIHLG